MNTEKTYETPQTEILQFVAEQVFATSPVRFGNEDYNTGNPTTYPW